ncbi:hypothetical protein [Leisingera sp. ANG-M6]|uniref:hypothetical protein n=1 Tax=Leisingera sp. ANG-M6 TaxID=1577900 RepID=UPI00057ED650|nr:hypothetical protein [Leisingera sp. ANG-M6]KIC29338.1 hypothetical protein RA24_06940 [Leisingera sp. ANG-M6]
MSEGPHWLEYFRALGPVVIASFVAYVAFQQWNVNRSTLREKLFDRRWQVFKDTQKFLSGILREATFDDQALWDYTDACQRARFLFGKKLHDYLIEIRSAALKMRLKAAQYKDLPVGDERSKLVEEEHEQLKWLNNQMDLIFEAFEEYISFQKAK